MNQEKLRDKYIASLIWRPVQRALPSFGKGLNIYYWHKSLKSRISWGVSLLPYIPRKFEYLKTIIIILYFFIQPRVLDRIQRVTSSLFDFTCHFYLAHGIWATPPQDKSILGWDLPLLKQVYLIDTRTVTFQLTDSGCYVRSLYAGNKQQTLFF